MNPDHQLLLDLVQGKLAIPVRVESNPLALDLAATLLAVDAKQATLQMAFLPGERFVQGNGVVQGGMVSAMLDFATAFAVLMQLPIQASAATAALDVQFLRAVPAGQRLLAQARVRRLGGRLAFASADLLADGPDGALLATATATLAVLR